MKKFKLFAVHNDPEWLRRVPKRDFIQTVNLDHLEIGDYQLNQLCESRLFLSDLFDELHRQCEYVGVMSARYNNKYPLPFTPDKSRCRLENLDQLKLHPSVVWAADRARLALEDDWVHPAETGFHNGHRKYIEKLIEISGYRLPKRSTGLWANNFICHASVFGQFLEEWRRLFYLCFERYGVDRFDFGRENPDEDESLLAAYFYERITTLYFASQTNLKIMQIP